MKETASSWRYDRAPTQNCSLVVQCAAQHRTVAAPDAHISAAQVGHDAEILDAEGVCTHEHQVAGQRSTAIALAMLSNSNLLPMICGAEKPTVKVLVVEG
jgi:hypothetical protein